VTQTPYEASLAFLDWQHQQVTAAGRGDGRDRLEVEPRGSFWLGRLASEQSVQQNQLGARGERLDPCAIEMRLRPAEPDTAWDFTVVARARTWTRHGDGDWRKDRPVEVTIPVHVDPDDTEVTAGAATFTADLAAAGGSGRSAEIRVEVERWHRHPELVVSLVNTSPPHGRAHPDTHLYETSFDILGLDTAPFTLEALPDSFRYDRDLPALGRNCGVTEIAGGVRTTDLVTVDKPRPRYWAHTAPAPDLRFSTLASDPLPQLAALIDTARRWGEANWSDAVLDDRARTQRWNPEMRREAADAARTWRDELARLDRGLDLLRTDATIRRAFQLANEATRHAARGRYDQWRPFQVGFLLGALNGLVDPDDADTVDTVWFATGGGKTETYLGLLITAVLYDRMTGKGQGITAWSRFPLRMLSLQQTQRFADALAGAEILRRREQIGGAPIRLGFFVGQAGTPNSIPVDAHDGQPDPHDPTMPGRYQVLLRCPFCHRGDLRMDFDRATWTLQHLCTHGDCPWPEEALPFHVVDQEIYRFLPAVVVGTLDKAALLGMQAAARGFVGPPLGVCSMPGHGYCYAPRSKTPHGCLVPGCRGQHTPLRQPQGRWAPRLRLQDELHLLRDSLGAVDAHYEALMDHLQGTLGGAKAKIVASSATLTGFDRQVDVLYQRDARVFPQPGPSAGSSFWSQDGNELARRYIAVAPRGVTLDFVSDRTLSVLQYSIRRLHDDSATICDETGIDPTHVDHLIDNYGVDVVYGNTIRDVEAARRSLDTQLGFAVNAETLTGATPFDDVRRTLDRLDTPEPALEDRVHVVAASSMMSHGVDIDRLNVMVMLGLPLTTAEFIQTTARVGRRHPGLVYVLHRIAREREAATFSQFDKFVQQGDRFVEPIPVTRRSRRVLALTTPGLVEARRLLIHEPASGGALTTTRKLRQYVAAAGITEHTELAHLTDALGIDGPIDELLRHDLEQWLRAYFTALHDPATAAKWPNELFPNGTVMRSLRDVEESAPVIETL